MESLKNKMVFITGASSGVGKACAENFAALGAHLIITARRFDRIKELANILEKNMVLRCYLYNSIFKIKCKYKKPFLA